MSALPTSTSGPEREALKPLRSISYGGGVQSTALLVLAAQGRIDFRTFLMANVGDDSEHPGTLRYLEEYARPFAADHDIELAVLDRVMVRSGETRTLYGQLTKEGSRSLAIPVRMSNGAPGTRSCTADFKIKVIGRELKRRGATKEAPATVGIGISLDEIHRANKRRCEPHEEIVYPLLELGLRRVDCARIIREAGLPVPPKSSCWFCPFHRPETWHDMRRNEPDLFEKSCQLEELLNERRDTLGKDHVYLTRFGRPLRQAIPDGVDVLPGFEDTDGLCDSGWCMT
ncbi:phosphoadenosine phosphosulfate reductase [Streptomyces rubiginosohelvolus]|uniref:Phosphoadenosine phosphosulfate reductase n=1 Tax=Streptomyces rubiginosohelvolus TaxID=67362 RepID=A0ABQ3CAC5_9ACTN|nr:phosphoadenosine phosphosulfate reductase [Streptomyces pluricolorescens]GGZ78845.1 phosphoadenosine phosphosulfate reductase [Streptomyces pluricolorescens]